MTQREKTVKTALGELGRAEPHGEDEYLRWYGGLPDTAPWCAVFVSWCAAKAGAGEGVFPKHASCTLGREKWKKLGRWRRREHSPAPGDLVYFDRDLSGDCDHVGLVVQAFPGRFETVEGNRGDAVARARYRASDPTIAGFAAPDYDPRDNCPEPWAEEALAWALERGVLIGNEKGDLRLTERPTREQVLTMLYRALGKLSRTQ